MAKAPFLRTRLFWGGGAFLVTGLAGSAMATSYGLGTVTEMGPGFFPLCTALALVLLGACAVVRSFAQSGDAEMLSLRPLAPAIIVLAAVLAFAALLDRLGLVPAVVAMVLISQLPRWRSSPLEVGVVAVLLGAAIPAIFVYGLKLPFRLFLFKIF